MDGFDQNQPPEQEGAGGWRELAAQRTAQKQQSEAATMAGSAPAAGIQQPQTGKSMMDRVNAKLSERGVQVPGITQTATPQPQAAAIDWRQEMQTRQAAQPKAAQEQPQAQPEKGFWESVKDAVTGAVTGEGRKETIKADSIILAVGYQANDGLYKAFQGKVPEVYCIGDCCQPAKILEAITQGCHTGLSL